MKLLPVINNDLLDGLTEAFNLQLIPQAPQWWVSDTVSPVALVQSSVTLSAILSKTVESYASGGRNNNPAANTVLADTGQLAAGKHAFRIYISKSDSTNSVDFGIEHRNAANDTTLLEAFVICNAGIAAGFWEFNFDITLVALERVRVLNLATGAGTYYAGIWRHSFT